MKQEWRIIEFTLHYTYLTQKNHTITTMLVCDHLLTSVGL